MSNYKEDLDKYAKAYNPESKYEFDNKLMLQWYPRRIAQKLIPGNILELGLGHGYSAREFASIATDYIVLDGSQKIINSFKKRNPDLGHVNIIHTYFEEFSTDQKFDNIIMGFILEHVDNPKEIIKKYSNYLSSNGKLFVTVPNCESLHRRLGHHGGMLESLDLLSSEDIRQGHKRYFDLESLKVLIKSCNMKIVSTEGMYLKILTSSQLESLNLHQSIYEALLLLGVNYPELSNAILLEIERG